MFFKSWSVLEIKGALPMKNFKWKKRDLKKNYHEIPQSYFWQKRYYFLERKVMPQCFTDTLKVLISTQQDSVVLLWEVETLFTPYFPNNFNNLELQGVKLFAIFVRVLIASGLPPFLLRSPILTLPLWLVYQYFHFCFH